MEEKMSNDNCLVKQTQRVLISPTKEMFLHELQLSKFKQLRRPSTIT